MFGKLLPNKFIISLKSKFVDCLEFTKLLQNKIFLLPFIESMLELKTLNLE